MERRRSRTSRSSLIGVVLAVALVFGTHAASAQIAPDSPETMTGPLDRPNQRPFEATPKPSPDEAEPRLSVPSPPQPPTRRDPADAKGSILIRSIRLTGNTTMGDEVLLEAAEPFLARPLQPDELQALSIAISRVYLEAGYVNSGALIPNQKMMDGVLDIRIVEGRLGGITIEGLRHYRARTLERRLRYRLSEPLRVAEIEEALRLLEADRNIQRLDARLSPTDERGVARLVVRVEETKPFWTTFGLDNYSPPSVGTLAGRITTGHDDVLGFGDRFTVDATVTEGLWGVGFGYEIPIHPTGTTFGLGARLSEADVVQPPFDLIDVSSRVRSYSASLMQPVYQTVEQTISLGVIAEHREGRTSLLGRGFTFAPGADDGEVRLTVLRPMLEWTRRFEDTALAFRSVFSVGLDVPSTTKNGGDIPDGRFFSWLAQLRGIYRHPTWGFDVHGRFDVQLSDQALLPLEQFALGGPGSVRGYRRNVLVRDQGYVGSVEIRVPIWTGSHGRRLLEISPFFDVGQAWNAREIERRERVLVGAGLGLRSNPIPPLFLTVEWAAAIRDAKGGDSLQGRGLLLAARWRFR